MVQQTMDFKFNEYGLTDSGSGLPKHDKELLDPVATKKTALRDLHNDNQRVVRKSVGSSLLPRDSGSSNEALKISGTKRAPPESLLSSRQQHSPVSNVANGHLVYVRRKPETESSKCSTDDSTSIRADYSQSRVNAHQNENIKLNSHLKESDILVPEAASTVRTVSECLPTIPVGSLPMEDGNNTLPLTALNHLQSSSSSPSLVNPERTNVKHWEQRYNQLQSLLKKLDSSNREGYIQMLRSFSSVELSRHAVELEKRSVQLSFEEAREWQRVMLLDVLGKYPKNSKAPLTQNEHSEVKGQ